MPALTTKGIPMIRIRIAVACLLLAGTLLATTTEAAAAPPVMVQKINKVRAKHGLRALRHAPSLTRSAGAYARVMMSRDFFGHSSHIRAPRRFRRLGEAIAFHRGRRPPRRSLRSWLRSPGHRALLLSPSFRYIGAGVSTGRFRGRRATIRVVHLGAR
jgi:uncharacterized protein YkwD